MPERDDLDRLLDESLSSYAEPVDGLAERVLRGIPTVAPRRRYVWLWPAALAAATALALLVAAPWRHPLPPHTAPRVQVAEAPAPSHDATPAAPRHSTATLRRVAARRVVSAPKPLPKLDIFPAPTPLSAEERALAGLVARSSAQERRELVAAQQQANAPIRISAITIPPIASPAEAKE